MNKRHECGEFDFAGKRALEEWLVLEHSPEDRVDDLGDRTALVFGEVVDFREKAEFDLRAVFLDED